MTPPQGLVGGERGRLTLPDVLFVLATLFFVRALWPVVKDGLAANAGELSTGSQLTYQLILPISLTVLLSVIYLKATAGVDA